MAKLTYGQVLEIRRKWSEASPQSIDKLGAQYGVSNTTITAIIKGKTWRQPPDNSRPDAVQRASSAGDD